MVDRERRRELIARYENGYAVIMEALDGITEDGLDAREAPEEWSPREVVHHLADSEMAGALRIRILIAQDHPRIEGYDQAEYARRLYYDRPIEASLAAFRAARESTAQILHRMTDADWQREGTHSESGPYPAERWLEIYAVHAHEHADQIRRARATDSY
jgi:hypothetical protein